MKLTSFEGQLLCSIMLSVRNACKLEMEGRVEGAPLPSPIRAAYLAECVALTSKVLQGYQFAQGAAAKVDPKLLV